MGERIRSFDWASTSLGPPEGWPQSLKTAIRIMLMSRQPVWVGWGQRLLYFYNDPYLSIIGGKHPWALGRPTLEIWSEIQDVIAPMLATAMSGDEGTYVESQLLIMERNGYPEETYYTFSYSPIPDDEGQPGGIFCANSDDTQRVIGQRELALLRDLAARTAKSRTQKEACQRSIASLETNQWDLPFAALYLVEEDGMAVLQGTSGIEAGHRLAPERVNLADSAFGFGHAIDSGLPQELALGDSADVPTGEWPVPANGAVVLPLVAVGESMRGGVLLVGCSPYRLLNEPYEGFLKLVAGQIAAAISDAEAIERERQRLEAMAELDRAKTAFFANVSHEFRTPLTLMLGPLQDVLANDLGEVPEAVRVELDTVQRNGLRLQRLVNSLLDFSRLEAGRMQAEFRPTDLATYSAELASSFRSAIERAGLSLFVDCPPLRRPAYVDVDLWEKVVLNLVSNALKHTFEGSIRVSVTEDERTVRLIVADTGTGIPSSELPHLFERFRRVDGARARTHEGSGIGLALVHEIVKLHGGDITVESQVSGPDRGTTFRVEVPLGRNHLPPDRVVETDASGARAAVQAMVGEALRWLPDEEPKVTSELRPGESPVPVRSTGARIVLADDNSDMRDYVTRLLGSSFEVQATADGVEAWDAIRADRPDLVLTDVMMPRLDGFGLVKHIREDAGLADLPVVMLSARAGEEARIEGLDAGADDYLVKPFGARELVARVDSAIALARLRQEATEALKRSEERLQMALGAARMVAWQWDPESDYLTTSENFAEIYGLPDEMDKSRAMGIKPNVHPEDAERQLSTINGALANGGGYVSQFRLRRPIDGQIIWLEERAKVERDADGRPQLVGVVMDITERKVAEQQRADAEALLSAEKRVLELITSGAPMPQVLDRLARETESLSRDGMMCSVLLLDGEGRRPRHGAAPSLPSAYNGAIDGVLIGPNVGSCGTAAYRQAPIWVQDIATDPLWQDFRELALGHGLRACSSRPILSSKGEVLGTVAMYFDRPHRPGTHDQELTERAARLAGVVIERDRALAAAETERSRLRDLFSQAPAIICVLRGPTHKYELANPLYLRLIGKPADEVLGRPIDEVLPELRGQGFIEILDGVYQTGEMYAGDEVVVRLDRHGTGELEEVTLSFVYLPSRNAQGTVEGILVHAVDVTDQVQARRRVEDLAHQLEERVQQRTAELLHANEQLQGFTYSVAHDLRQQIRGISTNAGIVLHDAADSLDSQSQKHLQRLVRSARQLGDLVDDLLNYAKYGRATPSAERVDLSAIASEIAAHLREHGSCSEATRFVIHPTPPATGDPSLLRIVIENLLDNACKYSRQGEAPVVEFGHDDDGYFVRDNGVGFSMEFVHKLFRPFERLHSDPSFAGTGIGLANVKRILEKHGGRVWAEGKVYSGATFRFTLPTPQS